MYSIERHIAPVIERRAKNSKAILLTGSRQVGKSTLFKHLFNNVNQVTFDDDLLLAQATDDIGLFLMNNPSPLMIDEVQKCPSIFNRLKIILDNTEEHGNFFPDRLTEAPPYGGSKRIPCRSYIGSGA